MNDIIYEMIDLKDLKVDGTYQREPNKKRIKKIATEWDNAKANLIHVSQRQDGYYVIDGNHTRLAYEKIGGEKIACRVHKGLTIQDEARLFSELNSSQKKPSFNEVLRAKAAANSSLESSYLKLLDEANIKYVFTSGAHGCAIKCHQALLQVYKTTTQEIMLDAFRTAKLAADGREIFYQSGYFTGLCSLIVKHQEIDRERLVEKVRKATASQIREIAEKFKGPIISGSNSATKNYRLAFIAIYNSGLRNKNKRIKEEPFFTEGK